MKGFCCVTKRFFAEIWSDAMMAALLFVPVIMGLAFRFGVPALEGYLCQRLSRAQILSPYYAIFDLLLAAMTPLMFTAAGALAILDEADAGLCRAIAVTPVGKSGYLLSHIGVPAGLSVCYCALMLSVFALTDIGAAQLALLSLCSGALGVAVALMIPSLSKNKVEGMAYAKLAGLFMLGLPAAVFVPAPAQYIAGVLPSLWSTKLVLEGEALYAIPAILTACLWALLFYRRFQRKLL